MDALRRVKLMAAEHTPVRLTMQPDLLELRTVNTDLGEAVEELDAKYDGEELIGRVQSRVPAARTRGDPGRRGLPRERDASKPAMLRSVDSSDFLYLLMPVRVS